MFLLILKQNIITDVLKNQVYICCMEYLLGWTAARLWLIALHETFGCEQLFPGCSEECIVFLCIEMGNGISLYLIVCILHPGNIAPTVDVNIAPTKI